MKIFLGTDICEINRIKALYEKYGEKFLKKTYTEEEIRYCVAKSIHTSSRLAVRFAAKEAVSKALGVGINSLGWGKGVDWKDVEIIRAEHGQVILNLHNKAKEIADNMGIKEWTLSVSHSKTDAIATVIGY